MIFQQGTRRTACDFKFLRRPLPLSHVGNGLPGLTFTWRVTRVLTSKLSVSGLRQATGFLTVRYGWLRFLGGIHNAILFRER
jgi:hypothetical protein